MFSGIYGVINNKSKIIRMKKKEKLSGLGQVSDRSVELVGQRSGALEAGSSARVPQVTCQGR